MRIIVNGELRAIEATTLGALLGELGKSEAKVATSVNEMFVPKALHQTTQLNDGDRVEIVAPRQGG